MKSQDVSPSWLDVARQKFAQKSMAPMDDWAASHASERGSFATFLGMTITKTYLVVYAIGDTVLFIVGADKTYKMWPEKSAQDFSVSPALLCSRPTRSAFPDTEEAFDESRLDFPAPSGGWAGTRLIAMTDALGEWVARAEGLEDTYSRLNELIELRDRSSFGAWVSDAIATGKVRRDDCAVLVVGL